MTETNDPDRIRAEIARTRAELSDNVDSLADAANPAHIAGRQVDKVKDAARSVRDRIMGSVEHDQGRLGEVAGRADRAVSAVGDAVTDAPARVRRGTRGNPLAAGLVVFGAGFLLASLIPASQAERQPVARLRERLEPVGRQVTETAKQMAEELREPAQRAAESVKAAAGEAANRVKDEGERAGDEISTQARESADTVRRTGAE